MDRFDVPGSLGVVQFAPSGTDDDKREDDERIALVWDRGPAGDFVYGGLNDLPAAEKRSRYEEFIAFDERVRVFFFLLTLSSFPHFRFIILICIRRIWICCLFFSCGNSAERMTFSS